MSFNLLSKNIKIKIYRTINLPVVLYGCGTRSLVLREECNLRVFKNKVLWRIYGPKMVKITVHWRKLHTEERNGMYSSPSFVRVIKSTKMRWSGHVVRTVERRGAYRVLVGET